MYVYYIKYVHIYIYMYTYIWNLKYSRKHQGYMLWLYNGIGRVLPTSLMGCSGEIVVRIINRCKSLIFHWRNSGYIVGIKPSDGHFIKMPIEFHVHMYIYNVLYTNYTNQAWWVGLPLYQQYGEVMPPMDDHQLITAYPLEIWQLAIEHHNF